jgi:hypothetical protein
MLKREVRLEVIILANSEPLAILPAPVLAVTPAILLNLGISEPGRTLAMFFWRAEKIEYKRVP